jgi:serine phosphatase RsbU (regulator of sigma subunit)
MTYCSAGHPPMITIPAPGPDHSAGRPRIAYPIPTLSGPPTGAVPEQTYLDHQVQLDPGDILIGYTDGLIERRDRSLDETLLALLTGLNDLPAQLTADVEAVADQVLTLAPPGEHLDDIAVLVIAVPAHSSQVPVQSHGTEPPRS